MESCPLEILHSICALIPTHDIKSVRLTDKFLASVADHYLFGSYGTVWFHCSPESLNRLAAISRHPVISQYVIRICYEATMLHPMVDPKDYKRSFMPKRAGFPVPPHPGDDAPQREMRLFRRNMQKWRQGESTTPSPRKLETGYHDYAVLVAAQREAFSKKMDKRVLSTALTAFPKLKNVQINNEIRCRHSLSPAIRAKFDEGFSPDIDDDSHRTIQQLAALLGPIATGSNNLESLVASGVSPRIFSIATLKTSLKATFSTLRNLDLSFRLEESELEELGYTEVAWLYRSIAKGRLLETIKHATSLEHLRINFDDHGIYDSFPPASCANVRNILGEHAWPFLKTIDLSLVCGNADEFIQSLERQPQLQHISLDHMDLEAGSWIDVFDQMRKDLSLKSTSFEGLLTSTGTMLGGGELLIMDFVDIETYFGDPDDPLTLADRVQWYVTSDPDDDWLSNPARNLHEFADQGELDMDSL